MVGKMCEMQFSLNVRNNKLCKPEIYLPNLCQIEILALAISHSPKREDIFLAREDYCHLLLDAINMF